MNRRSILRQSVKLSYATPLIAATSTLARGGVSAISTDCLAPWITVSGRVTDAVTGAPLSVLLDFPGVETFSDASGYFVLPCINADCTQCGYKVTTSGYESQHGIVSTLGLTDGQVINFQLVPIQCNPACGLCEWCALGEGYEFCVPIEGCVPD
jgi:hypothetical protein